MNGAQLSCVFNFTGEKVKGVQLGGILNIADDFTEVQLGLINISRQQNGIHIGLIDSSKNGGISLISWISNLMEYNTCIQFSSGFIYTIISARYNNIVEKISRSFPYGLHIGEHIPLDPFYLKIDISHIHVDNDEIFDSNKRSTRVHFREGLLQDSI